MERGSRFSEATTVFFAIDDQTLGVQSKMLVFLAAILMIDLRGIGLRLPMLCTGLEQVPTIRGILVVHSSVVVRRE